MVVDVQTRLMPAIDQAAAVLRRVGILIEAAGAMGVPITVTEQYSKGLGPTLPEVMEALAPGLTDMRTAVLEKTSFSALGAPQVAARAVELRKQGRGTVIVCGAEAHVCVLQTLLHLVERGFTAVLVADAVGARAPDSVALARERAAAAGVIVVSTEMVVFEWLERADRPEFKALSALIK